MVKVPAGQGNAPTLEEVAALSGVSRATASRVINGSPRVSPEAVEAVNAAIAQLNYVPNRAARALASRQTQAIALVIPEDADRFFGDPFFSSIVLGISKRIAPTDYVLNLIIAISEPSNKTIRYLSGGNVDGAIVVSHHTSDAIIKTLATTMPVVYGGRPLFDESNSYFVDVDNTEGAATATEHLIGLGRKKIATINGPSDMKVSRDRRTGWATTLEKAGLGLGPEADGQFTSTSGAAAMRAILDRDPDIDGLFAASDLMAAGAFSVLSERGYRVPEDVAVVGFDNSPVAVRGDIKLTTIDQPSEQMGVEMADMLLRILAGEEVREKGKVLGTSLVRRDSA